MSSQQEALGPYSIRIWGGIEKENSQRRLCEDSRGTEEKREGKDGKGRKGTGVTGLTKVSGMTGGRAVTGGTGGT